MIRNICIIMILAACAGLSAQERYITIPDKDTMALKQYQVNWHTGIRPVKTKDGKWVLPERIIDLIPQDITVTYPDEKIMANDLRIMANDLREYLISRPVQILEKTDFPKPTICSKTKIRN